LPMPNSISNKTAIILFRQNNSQTFSNSRRVCRNTKSRNNLGRFDVFICVYLLDRSTIVADGRWPILTNKVKDLQDKDWNLK
jgi:hypothetical protein